jgi:hypothetical protein
MILIPIYLIGFVISLTFLKYFGKRLGIDYDNEEPSYANYDDWDNNDEAYFGFATFWFILAPIGILIGTFILLQKFSKWYLKL